MSELEWTTEDEIQLFHALEGMKPVGIGKHFVMGAIGDRLSESLNKVVPREEIWKHLRTIYNLDLLDEREPIPFPNKDQEFHLPDGEFKTLISNKIQQQNNTNTTSGANITDGDEQYDTKNISNSSLNSSILEQSEKKTDQHGMNNGNSASGNNLMNSGSTKDKVNISAKEKDLDKKVSSKLNTSSSSSQEKRNSQKRTRGRDSLESNSPSTTPPPTQKRRRVL